MIRSRSIIRFGIKAVLASGLGLAAILSSLSGSCGAAEPGWSPRIVTFGEQREQIKSTPIVQRDYRPLHFYGNTVRRAYYRGNPVIMPRDVVRGTAVVATRR